MAEELSATAAGRRRRRRRGQRRPPTWEISDSDTERAPAGETCPVVGAAGGAGKAEARALRPKEAWPRLTVHVDPAILEDAGADILMEALSALGCEYRIEPQHPARSLQWSGPKPDPCAPNMSVGVEAGVRQELLLLLEPGEFLQGVAQLTQVLSAYRPRPSRILRPVFLRQTAGPACSVPWMASESPTCPHLAVIGLDTYLGSRQPSVQGMQQPQSSEETQAPLSIGWPEVEEALVLLQLLADLDVLLVASWQELSQHVCAFTKALAQRPTKQHRDPRAFSFCTGGRWATGPRVAKDGSGLRRAWWRQIRQFNRVSSAVADAVVTAFPSPRLLQQALTACSTEQERLGLLADLPVKSQEGQQPRRVGPDLSRRICLFLTTTNPDLLLDLGS